MEKAIKKRKEIMKHSIKDISDKRYQFIHEQEKSWDEETDEYKVDHGLIIDKLGDEILQNLQRHFDDLEFDFIFDELTKLGQAPSLIYDDNGHFAISSVGFQSVSLDDMPEDFEATMFIEAKHFADTPKEALKIYIFDTE